MQALLFLSTSVRSSGIVCLQKATIPDNKEERSHEQKEKYPAGIHMYRAGHGPGRPGSARGGGDPDGGSQHPPVLSGRGADPVGGVPHQRQ